MSEFDKPSRVLLRGLTVGFVFGTGFMWGAIGHPVNAVWHFAVGCVLLIRPVTALRKRQGSDKP